MYYSVSSFNFCCSKSIKVLKILYIKDTIYICSIEVEYSLGKCSIFYVQYKSFQEKSDMTSTQELDILLGISFFILGKKKSSMINSMKCKPRGAIKLALYYKRYINYRFSYTWQIIFWQQVKKRNSCIVSRNKCSCVG